MPLDAPADFRVSSYCSGGACVAVADTGVEVVVAHRGVDGASLHFTHEEWTAFVAGVKAGEFDLD